MPRISGSSVATALAAGLCSLMLTCDRLAHPGKKYKTEKQAGKSPIGGTKRVALVTGLLEKIQANSKGTTKHVLLDCFCDISKPGVVHNVANNDHPNFGSDGVPEVETILRNVFGMTR